MPSFSVTCGFPHRSKLARAALGLPLLTIGLLWLPAAAQSSCVSPPAGLVAWWPGEGTASDYLGIANGTLYGNVTFVPGKVGQCFSFDGVSSAINVPDVVTLALSNSLTIEGWVFVTNVPSSVGMVIFRGDTRSGLDPYSLNVSSGGGGSAGLSFGITSPSNTGVGLNSLMPTGVWTHVAVTLDDATGLMTLYTNAVVAAQTTTTVRPLGPLSAGAHPGVGVGNHSSQPGPFNYPFRGRIDELSVYNRALSAAEIQALYSAGASGKCADAIPPFIIAHPANQTVTAGTNVTFSVGAGGSAPLSYRWRFDGAKIAGATNSSLTLTNVQVSQAGSYSVLVTNAAGSVTSSNALLAVNFPPAAIRVISTNAAAGGLVSVPVVIVANGNESALGFSLNFDTAKLAYASAQLGPGAPGADLLPNTSLINSGKLGLSVVMPIGSTLSPGTQQVASVNYVVAVLTNATTTTNSFGDQPTPRQLWDSELSPLSATYLNGTVSITAATAFEADVFPRPNGDKRSTLSDWLQMGRYVARLDYPTNTGEFQRADSAPRASLGDGALTVTDWVQAGRYAFGLDPLTPVGGPTSENLASSAGPSATRLVTAGHATLWQGYTATVSVSLAAQGDENALAFSLGFDPSLVSFTGATLGGDATGATLYVNADQASLGRLGFAFSLGSGRTFLAGTREVIRISFRGSTVATGSFSPLFGDQLVPREVSDPAANALPASYVSNTIMVHPSPALRIALAGPEVLLTWPLWASNYVLQQAEASPPFPLTWTNLSVPITVSNSESVATLAASGAGRFYRLCQP